MPKSKKPRKLNLKTFLVAALRRVSLRWPPRNAVRKAARVRRGVYICNICKEEHRAKDVVVDHIIPVVDVKNGFTNWDDFVNSLFVLENGLQLICSECHRVKTLNEQKTRRKCKKT
jgi:5-methylcytosine-specific restriction endonuclease McrA